MRVEIDEHRYHRTRASFPTVHHVHIIHEPLPGVSIPSSWICHPMLAMWCADDLHPAQCLFTATLLTVVHMAADSWPARLEGVCLLLYPMGFPCFSTVGAAAVTRPPVKTAE